MKIKNAKRYAVSEKILRKGIKVDAAIKCRKKNYYSVEGAYPYFMKRGRNQYVWDVDNNKYLDYIMGYGSIILGHSNKAVNNSVFREIETGNIISPFWKKLEVELAERLLSILPTNIEMVHFMKTGSDATSGAIRLARIATGKNKIVRWGYNGWHDWSTPQKYGIPKCILEDVYEMKYGDLAFLERILNQSSGEVAAVIMMPVETKMPEKYYLQEIKRLAHSNGALFILDEMRTGFRLSLGGAQEYFDVEADLATYSKAVANGYAISVIGGRKRYMNLLSKTKLTATYFNSTFEMAAALETLKQLKEKELLNKIWKTGSLFLDMIKAILNKYNIKAEVSEIPPMPFIEFSEEQLKRYFYGECAKRGLLFHPNHHWYISAAHQEEDIYKTIKIMDHVLKSREIKDRI